MQAVIINKVGLKEAEIFEIEADDDGKILKMNKTNRMFYNECPQCGHKNKPYNNYCIMCRWELSKEKVREIK
jgi:uncharacterized OB-fold protein